ncbi:TPA: type I DNA topoisomerase [Candidatus Poribacteria bacterium]|nr:type I DNA topoisomerase [Candidatus Poribacteria bacterium]HEX29346.1 type I DNA topoisomerase [Candidatus Poribacteria bacterium]
MAKSLVVVESPAKAKTINKFLGKDFTVKASLGHIRDLPEKRLGVNIKDGFKPQYVTIKGKEKVIRELRRAAKSADKVYLAADPDREGEAICWHIKQALGKIDKPVYRITFNEITGKAIREALKNPGDININLVNAQQARRVLDRLVGYQISPILWRNVRKGLSAGRVQSVALRLVCEREEEREKFQPQEYWVISVKLVGESGEPFTARLVAVGDRKAEIEGKGFKITEEEARAIAEKLKSLTFQVESIKRQIRRQSPPPPFITSKLQQEANRRFRFPARKTMMIAQQLYEGVELGGEGPVGLVTYIRTDSTRVADEAIAAVRELIKRNYGSQYLPSKPNVYKSKKGAQDAHEAIRPTYLDRPPDSIKAYLSPDQDKLYNLIWRRFVASQMKPARLQLTTVNISADGYQLRASGSVILFDGFLRAYKGEGGEKEGKETLPELKEGEKLKLLEVKPEQFFTQPPPRYTEATLIKELEDKGIGRPSTYATIISTLLDRGYVVKEKGYLAPTDIGIMVNRLLIRSFPEIMNVGFTADMEDKLDKIEDGKADWVEVLREFYSGFRKYLEAAPDKIHEAKKEMEEETNEICEKCGRKMVIKWGKYGKFLACSGYPECTNTRPIKEEEVVTDQVCELCGSPMVIKTGRYGRFLSCSNYPKCKNTKPIGTGVKCPKCGGELVERRSKRGRTFYGCENFPKCDYAIWDKPVNKSCPKCGFPFLVEKRSKGKTYLACPNEGCDYVER